MIINENTVGKQPQTEVRELSQEEMLKLIIGKRIGQIHYFVNGTDGVSLQVQETETFLNSLGAITYSLAADTTKSDISSNSPELNYHDKKVADLRERISAPITTQFESLRREQQEDELLAEIYQGAEIIYKQMIQFIVDNKLDVVHIRNLSSLPFLHIQAAVAVNLVIQNQPKIKFILHHHDFYWEGPNAVKFATQYERINQLAEEVTAPNFANTQHICINTIAQEELKSRMGVDSVFIPDGFNFDKKVEEISPEDEVKLLEKYDIKENDLVLALTTRTRSNKGYQTAIKIVRDIQAKRKSLENNKNGVGRSYKKFDSESKIFLLVIQSADFDHEYYSEVKNYAEEMDVKLVYIGEDIVADAQYSSEDKLAGKHSFYSLTKSKIIDTVLYVSSHEGFGNQAIEAAWAKIIMMMFGYPVAVKDIFNHIDGIIKVGDSNDLEPWKKTGLPVVKNEVVEEATNKIIEVLLDHELEEEMLENVYNSFKKLCHIQKIGMQYLELYLN